MLFEQLGHFFGRHQAEGGMQAPRPFLACGVGNINTGNAQGAPRIGTGYFDHLPDLPPRGKHLFDTLADAGRQNNPLFRTNIKTSKHNYNRMLLVERGPKHLCSASLGRKA